jgi:hypothetical protein
MLTLFLKFADWIDKILEQGHVIDDYCRESGSCKAEYNDFEDCEIV